MSTTLVHKYQTLKAKKSAKRTSSEDIFPKHSRSASTPSSPITPLASHSTSQPSPQPVSYATFLSDLITVFNTLSAPSTAPTDSSSLHASFAGATHSAHVDTNQKKKVVKALQHADPVKVNEVIALLKAMPDPTTTHTHPGRKKTHSRESSSQSSSSVKEVKESEKARIKKQKQEQLDQELEEWDKVEKKSFWESQKINDQATGVVDPQSCKGPAAASWWFSSVAPAVAPARCASPELSFPSTATKAALPKNKAADNTKAADPATSILGSLWLSARAKSPAPPQRTLSTGEQIAKAAASLLATTALSKERTPSPTTDTQSERSLRRQASAPVIRSTTPKALLTTTKAHSSDAILSIHKKSSSSSSASGAPSYLIATINSLTRQLMTLHHGAPPVRCFWWGYSIYLNRPWMAQLQRASNTGQVFFGFLCSTIGSHPWLAALLPLISAWVGHQWATMKAADKGRGVVVSATWVLPVALASKPWEDEDDLVPAGAKSTLKSKLKIHKRV
ncbi:hypothetical protein BGZ72_009668 [Mortierella alpina]|nr:hypothetical protein BGZ72_009668 [Mortierella alpina]